MLLAVYGLKQLIKKKSRNHTSIDVIISNSSERKLNKSDPRTSFSDQDIVSCVRKINSIKIFP